MIVQGRYRRLIIGFLFPPILGALLLSLSFLILGKVEFAFGLLIITIPIAIVFTGLQSLIYSVLMEFYILPRINTKSSVIIIASVLGIFSGLIIGIFLGGFIGGIVGGYVGNYLYKGFHTRH